MVRVNNFFLKNHLSPKYLTLWAKIPLISMHGLSTVTGINLNKANSMILHHYKKYKSVTENNKKGKHSQTMCKERKNCGRRGSSKILFFQFKYFFPIQTFQLHLKKTYLKILRQQFFLPSEKLRLYAILFLFFTSKNYSINLKNITINSLKNFNPTLVHFSTEL